jgi:hypothetical protein
MKNGTGRFEFYLAKLELLLLQSARERNPGLWLYTNDARTTLFMLEALAKLYAGLHNENRFTKIKEDFKLLEDALGAIDYYDAFAKEFDTSENIPKELVAYLHAQAREKIQRLNDILQSRRWVGEDAMRIKKIREKLSGADWMKDKEEVKAIENFYRASIKEIKEFVLETGCRFTDVETQVHALRRKIRWLSIYPRALQGMIQLKQGNNGYELSRYLTPEVINSPFNKLPDPGLNRYVLLLHRDYFLALSWMISELGTLKDSGLRVVALTEAGQQVRGISHAEALESAYQLTGAEQKNIPAILSEASDISLAYFNENNLDKLIAGTAKTSVK